MTRRTLFSLVALGLTLGVLLSAPSPVAAAPTVTAPSSAVAITSAAVAMVGQQQGQCYTFMQNVVRSATGVSIGPDYRLGYLQSGAVEVPLRNAVIGDIIQLIDDRNTSPSADYPGMHTAIVLENYGAGRFKVVDSNANFDGIVRVRDYEPQAVAARYSNISVHVYHPAESGPAVPVPASSTGASAAPAVPLTPGATAVIAADGDCLRIRSIPALSGNVLGCLPTGGSLTVAGGAADADGYRWVRVASAGLTGWAAEQYLRGVATPAAAPPEPPSTTGKIVGGAIPAEGTGLVVYGGGSNEALVTASGCPKATAAFWASVDGDLVTYIPAASVAVVNARWDALFPGGIPAGTALMGRCA